MSRYHDEMSSFENKQMKPLNILLANQTLSLLAGSETWTYTLALQLKSMGHKVTCFGLELGIISDKLFEEGITSYDNLITSGIKPFSFILEEKADFNFDVIIANHNNVVDYLRSQFPTTPIISTIHGVIHFLEDNKTIAPEHPALTAGVNQFVAVSEEVQDKLKNDYGIESVIIRNFFDLKKFGSLKPPSAGKPKQFLINTNYAGKEEREVKAIREAAKIMGVRIAAVGQNFTQSFDITKAIEESDVVFGMGRSVLEGVAAGRLGFVQGRWGTGGVICEKNIDEIRSVNFSGRNSNQEFMTPEEIVAEVEKYYTLEFLNWGRNYIAKNHNVVLAAEEYIRIARELTGQVFSKQTKNDGVDPLAHKFRLATNVE